MLRKQTKKNESNSNELIDENEVGRQVVGFDTYDFREHKWSSSCDVMPRIREFFSIETSATRSIGHLGSGVLG